MWGDDLCSNLNILPRRPLPKIRFKHVISVNAGDSFTAACVTKAGEVFTWVTEAMAS